MLFKYRQLILIVSETLDSKHLNVSYECKHTHSTRCQQYAFTSWLKCRRE